MSNVNGMQANMGLSGVYTSPQGIATPSPSDTSLRLSAEAAQRQQQSHQIMSSVPLGAPQAFQQQFQQQMYSIQAQQSMNPYAAQALSHSQPGGAQQYLPSPITMTPANTGVFRPPPSRPAMAPISPTYTPSMASPMMQPFTPQAPAPMFGSPYEQRMRQEDIRANQHYAMMSQAPSALGYGGSILAGAGAGAAAGRAFGGWGAVAGAGIGALSVGMSGLASGVGDLAQGFMGPSRQRHQMGAGLQNMSQNWVTTGADMSSLGRGLNRDASLNLASQIQDMAGSSAFKKQTGGMFNSQDLMQITRQGGQSGLFDMAQDVPKIKQKLQETAGTIKQFMELTNDASVTSVIRQMGRLQQFGLNQKEMITAAQGMRSYARAAGTSIEGLQQIGGLPGASTFQSAGLTAGQGFQYGNFAAGTANQMVASGSISQRQLALQGGVQGMAQRDMQSQAAFASMPMFAASQSRYNNGSWGIDPNTAGRGDGAFGMVQGTLRSMNEAVNKGGVGALAMFQMKQKELSDTVLSSMSPMQALKQRMSTAMQTGQSMGMQGEQALAMGGMQFGMGAANQMTQMAKSPQFWEAKRQAIRQQQLQLGVEAAERNRANAPGMFEGFGEAVGLGGAGSWGRKTAKAFGDYGDTYSAIGGGIADAIGRGWNEHVVGTDVITSRFDGGVSGIKAAAQRGDSASFRRQASRAGVKGLLSDGVDVDQDLLLQADQAAGGTPGISQLETTVNLAGELSGIPGMGSMGTMQAGAALSIGTSRSKKQDMAARELTESAVFLDRMERAKREGGSKKKYKQAYTSISKAMGTKGKGLGVSVSSIYASKIDDKVRGKGGVAGRAATGAKRGAAIGAPWGPGAAAMGTVGGAILGAVLPPSVARLTEDDHREMAVSAMVEGSAAGGTPMTRKEAEKKYDAMSPEDKENFKTQGLANARKNSSDKSAYDEMEGDTRKTSAEQIVTATNQRKKKLQEKVSDTEHALDLDDLGADWMGLGASDDDQKTRDLAASDMDKFGVKSLVAALAAGKGDKASIMKQLREAKIGDDEQADILAELDELDKKEGGTETRQRYIDAGVTGVSLDKLNEYGSNMRSRQAQTAFGSSGFMKSFGKYSKKMGAHLGRSKDEITGKSIAKQYTKSDLANMRKFGGVEGKRFAKLAEFASYEGTDKKKQKLALDAEGKILEEAARRAEQDESGKEVQSKVTGDSDAAKALDKDLKAIDEMAAMFADFKPAIKQFAKGTEDLAAAMESDAISRHLEGNQ